MPAIALKGKKPFFVKTAARSLCAAFVRIVWPFVPRQIYLGRFPFHLSVALTRKCNANCVFCAYQFARKSDKIHMTEALFDRLIAEISTLPIAKVMLSPNVGEPTIAPSFLHKVRCLREAGVKTIEMTSNALYWHKLGLDNILDYGPDKINISFAGFDKEMYERDYRVGDYEQTCANILDLLRANARRRRPKEVSLWLRGDRPIETLMAAPEMAETRQLAHCVTAMTEVDSWLGLIDAQKLPDGYKLQEKKARLTARPCSFLFDLTIHPDGDIHLCSCRNVSGDPDMHIGNLDSMSLMEAHRGIPGVLEKWERGHLPASCRTCSMYTDPAPGLAGRFRRVRASLAARGVESPPPAKNMATTPSGETFSSSPLRR
jgi:MoaA/NifB/PqqE/SkfB family radical SAM enzyme